MKEWHQKQITKYQQICDQGKKNYSAASNFNNSENDQPIVSNDSGDAFEKEMNEELNIAQRGLAYVCQYFQKTPQKINIPKEASTDHIQNSLLDSPSVNAGLDDSITISMANEASEPVPNDTMSTNNDSFESQRLSNNDGSDKDDSKDSLDSSDSLIESSLKKKAKKSSRPKNSFLNKLLKPTLSREKKSGKENSNSDESNAGDLIDSALFED